MDFFEISDQNMQEFTRLRKQDYKRMVSMLDRLEYRWIKIEKFLLCLMGPNLQLADITESQIHTGNVRR